MSFELHTLGWEAFQNLCGHIAREILGQNVTAYAPSGDVGQDGAFQGIWKRNCQEAYTGRFILQCKFTAKRDEHLSLSKLDDELAKARKLAESSVAQTYLLITNAKLSGAADLAIRKEFETIAGIEFFDILGSEWITQEILKSKRLRAFVPRVYGLGDLSQILDERAYAQADEILRSWRDNIAKFVPTKAHERSVRALLDRGFVLLLGDPMAGKSTIAASLALAAADQWNCLPIFVTNPSDFTAHWNPMEPTQLFWIDDAFGQTQYDPGLTAGWNRQFQLMAAAIRHGARILFTSRTYIFNAAKRDLKKAAFPLLSDSQVIIEVEKLTLHEKEQILYNHLRLSKQQVGFKKAIKDFLPKIAADEKFFPEVARRLGDPLFTNRLEIKLEPLRKFVREPLVFLCEIISEMDRHSFSALSLLFMRGGKAVIPIELDEHETETTSSLAARLPKFAKQ